MSDREQVRVSAGTRLRRLVANWHGRLRFPRAGVANAACPTEVARVLLDYLKTRLAVRTLGFAREPVLYSDGWETYSYGFQLKSAEPLPAPFAQPLAVRIYCGSCVLAAARREIQVQRHLYELGYPVAE